MIKTQLGRYILAGGLAYVSEMLSLLGLHRGLGLSPLRSVAISFWVGFAVAFALQKLFAFKNYDRRVHAVAAQLVGYSLLVAFNYVFTLLAVKLLARTISVFVIRTVVIMVVTGWNFIIYRYLFKSRQEL